MRRREGPKFYTRIESKKIKTMKYTQGLGALSLDEVQSMSLADSKAAFYSYLRRDETKRATRSAVL